MKNELAASLVVVVLVLGAAAGYFMGVAGSKANTTTTTTSTSATYTAVLNNGIYLMKVNGSFYWSDDVSKDILVGMPGYSYFLNGSVTFDGGEVPNHMPAEFSRLPWL